MNILEAIDDPELFGGRLDGPSWAPWRAALAATFGLPMSRAELATYRACTGRKTAPRSQATELWAIIGRRGGKTYVLSLVATYLATFRDYSAYRQPGEQIVILLVAADRTQCRQAMGYIRGLLRGVPMLERMIVRETQSELELDNGVLIEVVANSYRLVRGRTVGALLADEVAFWYADGANPADEVLRAARPAMGTIPDSLMMVASTPHAKRGPVWATYRRYYAKDRSRVMVWRAASRVMNPSLPARVVKVAYEADPASAASEYGAEFRSDISAFLVQEVFDVLVDQKIYERPPVSGTRYCGFTDPSGGAHDAYTLAIGHLTESGIAMLDLIRETMPPFSPETVTAEYAETLKRYGVREVVGDRYSAQWVQEQFKKNGIGYRVSDKSKSEIYLEVLPIFNSARVVLLDNPRMVSQFVGLERKTVRAGRDSVDHGPHGADDIANSVAGCVVLCGARPRVFEGNVLPRTVMGPQFAAVQHQSELERGEAIDPDRSAIDWDRLTRDARRLSPRRSRPRLGVPGWS